MAAKEKEDDIITRGERTDMHMTMLIARNKTCREKSAEAIVAAELPRREGLNQARW